MAARLIQQHESGAGASASHSFAVSLMRAGHLRAGDLAPPRGTRMTVQLRDTRMLSRRLGERRILDAASRHFGIRVIDPADGPVDPTLIDRIGAGKCLARGLVPMGRIGPATLVATSRPLDFDSQRPFLEARLGTPVLMALARADAVEGAIMAFRRRQIAHRATSRVPAEESCAGWGGDRGRPELSLWFAAAGAALCAAAVAAPALTAGGLLAAGAAATLLCTILKGLALAAQPRRPLPGPGPGPAVILRPPGVSVIVPLYHEGNIAARLVARLSRLDYPPERLDVLLAVEDDDDETRGALARADLPAWMRIVVLPPGTVRTKPRALNLALEHCRGTIIGVYDAEDAPEPDQIRKVVARFHELGPDVACLQARLDYYNPATNWIARCFTLEYAGWFRLVLPGVARLGLVVPLGGTSMFIRRNVLEALGAWDAHNVTEDADLGVRLFRHGYRTEMLDSTTYEEANCRPWPWIRQRSRWLKGFMMTWRVHMRRPALLHRQLGTRRFLGFQVQFLLCTAQPFLAPVSWTLWPLSFGFGHLFGAPMLPAPAIPAVIGIFLVSAVLDGAIAVLALRRSGHRISPLWILALPFYFAMATVAGAKALVELVHRPHYWDKTSHGQMPAAGTQGTGAAPAGAAPARTTSAGAARGTANTAQGQGRGPPPPGPARLP